MQLTHARRGSEESGCRQDTRPAKTTVYHAAEGAVEPLSNVRCDTMRVDGELYDRVDTRLSRWKIHELEKTRV